MGRMVLVWRPRVRKAIGGFFLFVSDPAGGEGFFALSPPSEFPR